MEMKGFGDWASVRPQEMRASQAVGKQFGKLGLSRRITSAADDPAGTGIAARMRARAHSFGQNRDNASAGLDLARSAGGALDNVSADLGRMRELAIQASNGTLSTKDKANLDAEFQSLKEGIGEQMGADFAGIKMFSGESVKVVVDPDGGAPIEVDLPDAADLSSIDGADVATSAGAGAALDDIDVAMEAVASAQANLGASQGAMSSALRDTANKEMQIARSESRIADADVARESSALTAANLLQHAAVAMQVHQSVDADLVGDLLSAPF